MVPLANKVQTANQVVSECQRGSCREMNRYFQLLNFHNYDRALLIAVALPIAT